MAWSEDGACAGHGTPRGRSEGRENSEGWPYHVVIRWLQTAIYDPGHRKSNTPGEIECLRSVVTVAGQTMQRVAPHLMCALMGRLHDAYLEPSIPPRMRMVLLELIELRASGWQLKTSTQMYYNPGKAFQHHE
ncbi:hypothetical protein HPB49_022907 [Dermacentor silvarum]|uniref:Uncharacterized protein n=1 Tax=Dermacentor silvarum TaxID=543639 RepID=A0ACB8DGL2_DERSI|nr:hypothetical protein HPB49_022907 [Dermacentor silvarum]